MADKNAPTGTIGIDLGGTKIEAALVDGGGRVVSSSRTPTKPEGGPEGVLETVAACVRDLLKSSGAPASAVGVGIAGQVDANSGEVFNAPNLGWRNVQLGRLLAARTGLPVRVDNDVRAAAFGEWRHGAGRGERDVVCVFVGTGIGGGVVAGGRLLRGSANSAGEIGHTPLVFSGRKCTCPNRGCLEAYAGGWAIADRAREAVRAEPEAGRALAARAGGMDLITAATVGGLAREGDALARRLMDETAEYLAAGLVGTVNAFNPALLILGGGVVEGSPELIPLVEARVRPRALPSAARSLRIVKAALGNDAGVVGAAAMARGDDGADLAPQQQESDHVL